MNKGKPSRLLLILVAFVAALYSLMPTKSVDVAVTGNSNAQLTLDKDFTGWKSKKYTLAISGNGTVGEAENLTADLLDEKGEILKGGINLGAGYVAGARLPLGPNLPKLSMKEGTISKGVKYHLEQNVEYINLGLDLVGGSEIIYEISEDKLNAVSSGGNVQTEQKSGIKGIVDIFQKKLNNSGMKEIFVQSLGANRILVQLPGLKKSEVDRIKKILERQGKLEFKIVNTDPEMMAKAKKLEAEGKSLAGYELVYELKRNADGTVEKIPGTETLVARRANLTGKHIINATAGLDSEALSGYAVNISFNSKGQDLFERMTERNIGTPMAIILDDGVVSKPVIRTKIVGDTKITGNFSEQEAHDLVTVLRSGSMDVKPKLYTENSVGPTLGSDSIKSGIESCLLGSFLVLIAILFYYRFKLGLVAVFALFLNMIFLLGTMAFFKATLTLPGIAGLALTIGMAVDATVLIYERLREESLKKQNIKVTLTSGYERAFITIFDSNFTTFITAAILFMIGNSAPVKGFCATLMLGLSINLFSAVFVTQTILGWAAAKGRLNTLGLPPLKKISQIDFFKFGSILRFGSLVIICVGILAMYMRSDKILDVDFEGGNLLQIQLKEERTADDVRSICKKLGHPSAIVQNFGLNGNAYTIRTAEMSDDENKVFQMGLRGLDSKGEAIFEGLPLLDDDDEAFPRNYTIGANAAKEMLAYAIMALIAAMLVILFYIMVRFAEFKYGLGACVALVHDVLITICVLSILDFKINLTIFAGLLTVVGYSLNDTIVIFDRIRENIGSQKNYDFTSLALKSLNQTFTRTIRTSVTTLLVILTLLFLGGGVITGFAVTMFVGVLTGTYSSIFIATPFVKLLHSKDPTKNTGSADNENPTDASAVASTT